MSENVECGQSSGGTQPNASTPENPPRATYDVPTSLAPTYETKGRDPLGPYGRLTSLPGREVQAGLRRIPPEIQARIERSQGSSVAKSEPAQE